MKKILIRILKIVLILVVVLLGILYLMQESLIFHPEKLDDNYTFKYEEPFEEINLKANDGTLINGLLFKADSTKGVILYLHGNAGTLATWGGIAETYTQNNYDIFIPDYRGFGKSGGSISSEQQLFDDAQLAYDKLKEDYNEDDIIVMGYSIGTGIAAHLASQNKPQLLILKAPYYSLVDMMKRSYPFAPTFLLKYKLETGEYLKECKMPITLFHGDKDTQIPYESCTQLSTQLKDTDSLITLIDHGHNGFGDNIDYINALSKILARTKTTYK
jgi:uncharacterized protein